MTRASKGPDCFDVAIVGAGAAGMYCAAQAGAGGRRHGVLHCEVAAGKRCQKDGSKFNQQNYGYYIFLIIIRITYYNLQSCHKRRRLKSLAT